MFIFFFKIIHFRLIFFYFFYVLPNLYFKNV